jgi:hypothetical protein
MGGSTKREETNFRQPGAAMMVAASRKASRRHVADLELEATLPKRLPEDGNGSTQTKKRELD